MYKFIFLLVSIVIISCKSDPEDKVRAIDKDGSVEYKINPEYLNDSYDIIKTYRTYWIKGNEYKTLLSSDTVPSLGMTKDTVQTEQEEDTIINMKKHYQIFVTIQ
jgi:hypothetical protein